MIMSLMLRHLAASVVGTTHLFSESHTDKDAFEPFLIFKLIDRNAQLWRLKIHLLNTIRVANTLNYTCTTHIHTHTHSLSLSLSLCVKSVLYAMFPHAQSL